MSFNKIIYTTNYYNTKLFTLPEFQRKTLHSQKILILSNYLHYLIQTTQATGKLSKI